VVVKDEALPGTGGELRLSKFDAYFRPDLGNGARAGLAGRADLAEQFLARLELVRQEGIHPGHGHTAVEDLSAGSERNTVVHRTNASYVKGFGECDAQAPALAQRVIEDALVLAQDFAARIKYGARMGSGLGAKDISVVALAGETQLHAVGPVGNTKSSCAGQAADLLLGELSQGKHEPVEPLRRDAVEKVALVSGGVSGASKTDMTVRPDEAGIVTGG